MEIFLIYDILIFLPFGKQPFGEVAEWFKAPAWKACDCGNMIPGFKSLPLRHSYEIILWILKNIGIKH